MNGINAKTVVVTGAGSGIGRASARRFAAEGANVLVTDIDEDGGRETVDSIAEDGGEATFLEVDVTDGDDIEAMVKEATERYGSLDLAHNNVGEGEIPQAAVADIDENDWNWEIEFTLNSIWRCMKHEIPQMLEQGSGAIVNTASVAGLAGSPYMGGYSASKHGVIGLTRTAGFEYAADGIRINAVCPGAVETPKIDNAPGRGEQQVEAIPMKRVADPEEIAAGVVWLCSDDASYITGFPLSIDGGLLASP